MKILIIDLDNVGDVVMASFLPRALKSLYPDSYISVLVKEYSQDIFRHNTFINEMIIFNPPWLGDMLDKRFTWQQTKTLVKKLKTYKFDLAIVVNSDWRKALLAKLACIPIRVGANKKKSRLFLTKPVAFRKDPGKHTVQENLDLLKALGYKHEDAALEVFVDKDMRQWADRILLKNNLESGELLISIHPGAGHPARIWPAENYIKLINALQSEPKLKIVVAGSAHDHVIKEIEHMINKDKVIILQDISILQVAALFKKSACVVAQDSGPMHLATAVGTRVVAIFGPSNPSKFGPYGKGHIVVRQEIPCSPCGSDPECEKLDCIRNLAVEDVLKGIKALI
jgi:lipopolysaccharide heptosyltransferase II